jgi:NAD(P)-dependent dehydrogenase (short-subunit alcohol dehydrogenase family)
METMTTLRRALITGATSGIGSAFTSALPSTDLLLTGRNGGRLVEMCAELERPDREVDFVQADLACVEERETLISRAEEFGIDLLVNNAGLGPYDRAGEHHLGHHGAVAVGARDEHAHVIGTVLVDPARAVEAQHLPGRGGGDHHIADVVDRGDQTRQLDDVGAVAIEDQDGAGVDQDSGAGGRLEGKVPGRAVPDVPRRSPCRPRGRR